MLLPSVVFTSHGSSRSDELEVVGHLSAADTGVVFIQNITDVWAYGNYAYLGTFNDVVCTLDTTGSHIVDISNPTNPSQMAFIAD